MDVNQVVVCDKRTSKQVQSILTSCQAKQVNKIDDKKITSFKSKIHLDQNKPQASKTS